MFVFIFIRITHAFYYGCVSYIVYTYIHAVRYAAWNGNKHARRHTALAHSASDFYFFDASK